jgi:cytochrome bd-type quinol oxidase subunit 2
VDRDYRLVGRGGFEIIWGEYLMRVVTAVIAIAFGILILGGYFFPALADIQTLLLNWAIILAGVAALVGIFNLISVHTDKVRRREKGSTYSAILVIALIATFIFGLILRPDNSTMEILMNGIIVPVEASLLGLLTISLIYAAIRLLRRRANVMSIVFLVTAALIILGSATLPFGNIPLLGTLVRPWITQVLALGGARGILIGVALGTLTTGLRVLFGADRPYGGN